MFPTSSSTDLVGRNARSAAALINGGGSPSQLSVAVGREAAHSLRDGSVNHQL